MKSNLTAERWRSDPAFAGSRKCAATLAQSAVIAGGHYQVIPSHQRCYRFYRRLVGLAQEMFCAGFNSQQVHKVLDFAVCKYLRKMAASDPGKEAVRSSFSIKQPLSTVPTFRPAPADESYMPVPTAIIAASHPVVCKKDAEIPIRGRPYRKVLPNTSVPPITAMPMAGSFMPLPAIFLS